MDALNRRISVVDPVNLAIERTKLVLFRPFDISKWFVIGFCAFLAQLSKKGFGGGLQGFGGGEEESQIPPELMDIWHRYMIPIIIGIAVIMIIMMAISVLFTWLSSRGMFMFLDCLVKNKGHVKQPWGEFKTRANSLFWFRLLVTVSAIVFLLPVGILLAYWASIMKGQNIDIVVAVMMLAIIILVVFLIASFFGTVRMLTIDFAVPIMYIQGIGVFAAWRKLWPLIWSNIWKITLYLLFKGLIVLCVGAIIMLLICVGCCLFCVSSVVFIPYIGTVAILPFSSFNRLYSVYYIRQYGDEFDVFISRT